MSLNLNYYIIDVFTDKAFKGNPVAVFFDCQKLTTEQMQTIASWTNLSETTFLTKSNSQDFDYNLRIFTPKNELPFAGHPTIGSAAAFIKYYNISKPVIKQKCAVGLIELTVNDNQKTIHLSAPTATMKDIDQTIKNRVADALNIKDSDLNDAAIINCGPLWLTARVANSDIVKSLNVNLNKISHISEELKIDGITIAGKIPSSQNYKVRTFAPYAGINEDPICGSGNIAVAKLISAIDKKDDFNYIAYQGQEIERDGKVIVECKNQKITIGGQVVITSQAKINLS